jgi:uncharacterized protein (DUF433 family)
MAASPDPSYARRPNWARDTTITDWSERDVIAAADWAQCDLVERIVGKVSGAWLVKGTRLPVWAIMHHADDYTPEEIATEIYPGVPADVVRRIIAFARAHVGVPA